MDFLKVVFLQLKPYLLNEKLLHKNVGSLLSSNILANDVGCIIIKGIVLAMEVSMSLNI